MKKFTITIKKPFYLWVRSHGTQQTSHVQVCSNTHLFFMSHVLLSFHRYFIFLFTFHSTSDTCFTRFHYDTIMKKYGNKIQLLFRETNSLMYEVITEDFYQDMWPMKEFDLARYPKSSPF